MPMMGSGRRMMQPDEIPPIFYFIIIFMVVLCVLALLINFIFRSKNTNSPGVVDAYKDILTQRMRGRTHGPSNSQE